MGRGDRGEVLLGTVAIEPNRWGTIRPDRSPETHLAEWVDRIADLGVDGMEVWDGHLTSVGEDERRRIVDGPVPVRIFNSYVDFDDPDDTRRTKAARQVASSGARAVKFNVGNDLTAADAYAERLRSWLAALPDDVVAICECHAGISVAEDPAVAARILGAAPVERAQALVHTHDGPDVIAAKFDALGDRISHVHVNHLDAAALRHPPLTEVEDRLGEAVREIRRHGFTGSWTLEFVSGLLTDDDHPAALLDAAEADLAVLGRVLDHEAATPPPRRAGVDR